MKSKIREFAWRGLLTFWKAKSMFAVLIGVSVTAALSLVLLDEPLLYYALVGTGWFGGKFILFASPKYSVETNY